MSELEDGPVVMCLKVVPDALPNDDGVWRKFVVEHEDREPRKYGHRETMWDRLTALVSKQYPGHHVVGIQSDLRFADKPGNWWPQAESSLGQALKDVGYRPSVPKQGYA